MTVEEGETSGQTGGETPGTNPPPPLEQTWNTTIVPGGLDANYLLVKLKSDFVQTKF